MCIIIVVPFSGYRDFSCMTSVTCEQSHAHSIAVASRVSLQQERIRTRAVFLCALGLQADPMDFVRLGQLAAST